MSFPGDEYSADQVVDKTLIALADLPVYRDTVEVNPFGWIAAGQPIGVVYSYLAPNPAYGRSILWWQFKDPQGVYYYSPQRQGLYDLDALRQQGVISTKEQIEQERAKDNTWYENLIEKYGLWVAGALIVAAGVKGFASRPSK